MRKPLRPIVPRWMAGALGVVLAGIAGCDLVKPGMDTTGNGENYPSGDFAFLGKVALDGLAAGDAKVTLSVGYPQPRLLAQTNPAEDGSVFVPGLPEYYSYEVKAVVTVKGYWPGYVYGAVTVHPTWCHPTTYALTRGRAIQWQPDAAAIVYAYRDSTGKRVRAIVPEARTIENAGDFTYAVTFSNENSFVTGVNRLAEHPEIAHVYEHRVEVQPAVVLPPPKFPNRLAVGADELTVCSTMDELVVLYPGLEPQWFSHLGDTALFWVAVSPSAGLSLDDANTLVRTAQTWLNARPGIRAMKVHAIPYIYYYPGIPLGPWETAITVRLKLGATVDDLRGIGNVPGLPLSSARFERERENVVVIFNDRAMYLFGDAHEVAELVKKLPPVETAYPYGADHMVPAYATSGIPLLFDGGFRPW